MKAFFSIALSILIILQFNTVKLSGRASTPYENSHITTVDGIKIHYRQWKPEGDIKGNIFLVHGFGGSIFSWENASDSLCKNGYNIVAADIPPFGYSDKSSDINQSVTAKADLLINFLKQEFPEKKWHLAGHSMGGAIVQAMGIINPEDYISINFVSAALFLEITKGESMSESSFFKMLLNDFLSEILANWFVTNSRIEKFLNSAYGTVPSERQINEYMAPFKMPETISALLNSPDHSFETHSLKSEDLSVPWIAIWGDQDTWVPLEARMSILEKMNPEVNLAIIENCGHNPMETHIDEFMGLYINFLEGLKQD